MHGLSLVTVKMYNNPKTSAACKNLLSFTRLKISWIAHAFVGGLGAFLEAGFGWGSLSGGGCAQHRLLKASLLAQSCLSLTRAEAWEHRGQF